MRKARRKIKRKKRKQSKPLKKKSLLYKHLSKAISNRFTRITTYIIILLEVFWVFIESVWFIIDVFIRR